VGIGPGSISRRSLIAGVGVPQISAIARGQGNWRHRRAGYRGRWNSLLPAIIAKALAAGAHCVMIGGMFAGTENLRRRGTYQGGSYKAYRGMGSLARKCPSARFSDRYFQDTTTELEKLVPEGIEGACPTRGVSSPFCTSCRAACALPWGTRAAAASKKCARVRNRTHHQRGRSRESRSDVTITKKRPTTGSVNAGIHADRVLILDFGASTPSDCASRARTRSVFGNLRLAMSMRSRSSALRRRPSFFRRSDRCYDVKGLEAPAEVFSMVFQYSYLLRHADHGRPAGRQVESSTHASSARASSADVDSRLLTARRQSRRSKGRRVSTCG